MRQGTHAPVLMIGLDAAELTLVERWMAEGALPQLRALRERGTWTRLGSTAQWHATPWASFSTGTPPEEHGLYHYLLWRPALMASVRPAPEWLPQSPFWRAIAAERRVVAMDVPLSYAPGNFGGVEINGWATQETLQTPASWPPLLLSQVRKRFGNAPLGNEEPRLFTARELLATRDRCIRSLESAASVASALMRSEPWDLFLLGLSATHRAGHQLWDQANIVGEATPQQADELVSALRKVYIAADAAVGRLVSEAGPGTTVLVFALHGMGPNVSRCEVLGEMLSRILASEVDERDGRADRKGPLARLRTLVPAGLRSAIKGRLPYAVQDWLTQFWRTGGLDWSTTKAFAPPCDLDGYVRINLRGREAEGIVQPGAEYEALCATLADGLASFADADTGGPVVDKILRRDDLYESGANRELLPDLIVRWADTPAASHRVLVSARYGEIAWPTPGRHPEGRSGNHRPGGFLIAAGDAIGAGVIVTVPCVLDLAPTVYDLLGLPVPGHMHGRPLFRHGNPPE